MVIEQLDMKQRMTGLHVKRSRHVYEKRCGRFTIWIFKYNCGFFMEFFILQIAK